MISRWLPAGEVTRHTLALQDSWTFPMSAIWRAASFQRSEGLPMTLRRARALNAVLAQCALPVQPGELLLGSGQGRNTEEGDALALATAREYLAPIGSRNFTTHFDHMAPDYATLLQRGIGGLMADAQAAIAQHTGDRMQEAFLLSVVEALGGAAHYMRRWADEARRLAGEQEEWAPLLNEQAMMLTRLAITPPRTLWEAVQLLLLFHTMFQLDDRYAMAFGRLDELLYPFYASDLAAGRITPEFAQALFDHFIAKLAHRGDIQNICIGGVTPAGDDATNAVSLHLLEAVQRIGQPGGNLTARVHAGCPETFLLKCAEVIRTGIGFPAMFNDEVEIPALVAQGYPLEEARDYCFVGCIEAFIPGRMAPWADSRFNLLRCVNLTIWNGYDTVTQTQMGPKTGEPQSWPEFYEAFRAQVQSGIDEHIGELNAIKQAVEERADDFTSPLLSAVTADCLARGHDLCAGGSRYPANHGLGGMGIGSVADSLMAVKQFVYEERRFTLDELRRMLAADFVGYEVERKLLLHSAPKYGNDDERVDELAISAAREFAQACAIHHTPRGGHYWGLMAANIQNIDAGREVGATPDGRLALQPLSDAASPTFGRDTHGPTAVVRSVAKVDYAQHPGGNVINMKFHPSALAGDKGLAGLAALIRTCFSLGGIQLQFNTTDRAVLQQAMERPEDYRHLVVRVSGFSAYFTGLDRAVQEDILARTDHQMTA